ncbi:uncharacterized protein LOC136092416 [Hydra vulgaris]|uniref:Uncharacterized protein LOC136092416 n=1 Tax=Hydra vulgaris TaxID=6087 RepID=A0ABM4DQ45_HYDVU
MFHFSCKILQRTLVFLILLIAFSNQKLQEENLKPKTDQEINGGSLDAILNATRNAVLKHIPETYLSFQNVSYVLKLNKVEDAKGDEKSFDLPENGNIPLREIIAVDEQAQLNQIKQSRNYKFKNQALNTQHQSNQTNFIPEHLQYLADEPRVVIKGAKLISYRSHHNNNLVSKNYAGITSVLKDETGFKKDLFKTQQKINRYQDSFVDNQDTKKIFSSQFKSSGPPFTKNNDRLKYTKFKNIFNDLSKPFKQNSNLKNVSYARIKQKQSTFLPILSKDAIKTPFNNEVQDLNDLSQDIFDEHSMKKIDDSQTNIDVPIFASVSSDDLSRVTESNQLSHSTDFYTDYNKKENKMTYPGVYPITASTYLSYRDNNFIRTPGLLPTVPAFPFNPTAIKIPAMITGRQSQLGNIVKDNTFVRWPPQNDLRQYNKFDYSQPSYGQFLYNQQSTPNWNFKNKIDLDPLRYVNNEIFRTKPETNKVAQMEQLNQQSYNIYNIPFDNSVQQWNNPPKNSIQQPNFPTNQIDSSLPTKSSFQQSQRKTKLGENLNKIRILCIGDSLTSGYYGNRKIYHPYSVMLGYLLKKNIGNEFEIINKGVGGEKVHIQMYKRLEKLLVTEAPLDLVVILGGLNDLIKLDIKVDIFSEIEALHELCHSHGVSTVSLTIPETRMPLSKRVYSSYNEFLVVWGILNEKIRNYKSNWTISCDLARQFPLASLSDPEKRAWWSDDYIHPTIAGYDQIGRIIYDCIVSIL